MVPAQDICPGDWLDDADGEGLVVANVAVTAVSWTSDARLRRLWYLDTDYGCLRAANYNMRGQVLVWRA